MPRKKVKEKTTTKKAKPKKITLPKKTGKPVKVTFKTGHKRNPQFEEALEQEAAVDEIKQADELKEQNIYLDPDKSRGSEAEPESTIPPNAVMGVAPVLKIPFAIWSNIKEIPTIRLSDKEAQDWAGPIVDLLEFYFPGKVPEIAWMWLMFLTSTAKVIDSRIEIVHQEKKKKSQGPAKLVDPIPLANQPGPPHNGAEPGGDYPEG